jgi:type IV pilus assembly protein PilN
MPRINLLPWREEQRKERKLAFAVSLGVSCVLSLLVMGAAYLMFNASIESQRQRNERLRGEIKQLDKQIEEINSLETEKQNFIARMDIIEKLQRSRPEIVHVFDEIARTLPDGVYLTGVKQTDKRLKFDGVAQSSTRVSTFMRNIDGSDWLRHSELEVVQTAKNNAGSGSSFTLFAEQVSTTNDADAGGKGKAPVKGKPAANNKVVASRGAQQ